MRPRAHAHMSLHASHVPICRLRHPLRICKPHVSHASHAQAGACAFFTSRGTSTGVGVLAIKPSGTLIMASTPRSPTTPEGAGTGEARARGAVAREAKRRVGGAGEAKVGCGEGTLQRGWPRPDAQRPPLSSTWVAAEAGGGPGAKAGVGAGTGAVKRQGEPPLGLLGGLMVMKGGRSGQTSRPTSANSSCSSLCHGTREPEKVWAQECTHAPTDIMLAGYLIFYNALSLHFLRVFYTFGSIIPCMP